MNLTAYAEKFKEALSKYDLPKGFMWIDDDEAGFEWTIGKKSAFVSIEEDGIISYAYYDIVNDCTITGKEHKCHCDRVPRDLLDYLLKE